MTGFLGYNKLYKTYKMILSNPFSDRKIDAFSAKLRVEDVKLGILGIEEFRPYMGLAKHHVLAADVHHLSSSFVPQSYGRLSF